MMKNTFVCMIVLAGITMMAGCSEKTGKKQEVVSKIQLSGKDSASAIALFETYLGYSQAFADSAAMDAESLSDGAAEGYQQNRVHVDSVLHNCIVLVKQRNYDKLLTTLEKERFNIYTHPGNMVNNETGLVKLFSLLYNQVYPEAEDSFYMKMLPIYEFTLTHMEMLEMMGKERHPDYEAIQHLVNHARELTESPNNRNEKEEYNNKVRYGTDM
jgi:hypothetical protein